MRVCVLVVGSPAALDDEDFAFLQELEVEETLRKRKIEEETERELLMFQVRSISS